MSRPFADAVVNSLLIVKRKYIMRKYIMQNAEFRPRLRNIRCGKKFAEFGILCSGTAIY